MKFDGSDPGGISSLGLDFDAVARNFLGNTNATPLSLLEGIPPLARWFANREHHALDLTFSSISVGRLQSADPWTGETVQADAVYTSTSQADLPLEILPLMYQFNTGSDHEFWLCIYSVYGRATQLYIPSADCMIFDISESHALAIHCRLLEVSRSEKDTPEDSGTLCGCRLHAAPTTKLVGLLDMPTNFGHQILNGLSGVQRLHDLKYLPLLDELWVCGVEFFPAVEAIFPELEGKITRFENRWSVGRRMREENASVLRIGANFVQPDLRSRIMALCGARDECRGGKKPLCLCVTVRATGRVCVNLAEAVGELSRRLIAGFPDLEIMLDGWVFPQSLLVAGSNVATATSPRFVDQVRKEMDIAAKVMEHLPHGIKVRNCIGLSMTDSIRCIQDVDVYFSHVGTIQHKLGFFTRSPGVVHGPRSQMQTPEGAAFQSGTGVPPTFMAADAIEDVVSDQSRGSGFHDYRITSLETVHRQLQGMLRRATVG